MQATTREQLFADFFPEGVPSLWCPPLTHYTHEGAIDPARMAAHLKHLAANVRGYLIPGSTGDGWELTPSERRQVLKIALEQAQKLNAHILIGALNPDLSESL